MSNNIQACEHAMMLASTIGQRVHFYDTSAPPPLVPRAATIVDVKDADEGIVDLHVLFCRRDPAAEPGIVEDVRLFTDPEQLKRHGNLTTYAMTCKASEAHLQARLARARKDEADAAESQRRMAERARERHAPKPQTQPKQPGGGERTAKTGRAAAPKPQTQPAGA